MDSVISPAASGSSPRVRGTPCRRNGQQVFHRFIPACAGNAPPGFSPHCAPAVHPRVCGERYQIRPPQTVVIGSSPRVRGTRSSQLTHIVSQRFIPACAGNAVRFRYVATATPVHPRVCGERMLQPRLTTKDCGSSPRVRGTQIRCVHRCGCDRFIPACAGNAAIRCGGRENDAVHPRVCGERVVQVGIARVSCGSSPRVRGTRRHRTPTRLSRRFIPACAGNAESVPGDAREAAVHPRVCGERGYYQPSGDIIRGSSPRVRGTR